MDKHESDHDTYGPLEPGHELWKEPGIQRQDGNFGEDLHQNIEHLAGIVQLQQLDAVGYWYVPIMESKPHEGHSKDDD